MLNTLLAGCGGFLGAAARYWLGGVVQRALPPTFPFGTFVINVTGCFAIGVLSVLIDDRHLAGPGARVFWIVGILGGYTTFSAFGYETVLLLRQGGFAAAAVNVIGQVAAGILAVWAGAALAGRFR